jgi:poly(3-hydroxybutyrate) depolymerase
MRAHHLQEGVGHYGVFNGSKFKAHVAPIIKEFIRSAKTAKSEPKNSN